MTEFFLWDWPTGTRSKADWDKATRFVEKIVCPVDPGHNRAGPREHFLKIALKVFKRPSWRKDIIWCIDDCLVTDRVREIFLDEKISGVEFRKTFTRMIPKRKKDPVPSAPRLWELRVIGYGGIPRADAGIEYLGTCPGCGKVCFTAVHEVSAQDLVDETQWDGSDMFRQWGLTVNHEFITDRVRRIVRENKIEPVEIIPAREAFTLEGHSGSPKDPEVLFPPIVSTTIRQDAATAGIELPPPKYRYDEVA